MNKNITWYTNVLGRVILVLSLFSSLFISGIYSLNKYGSIFNYILFALFVIYTIMYLITYKKQKKDKLFYCVLTLLLLNFISILTNSEKIFNLKLFIITAIQWVILFQYARNDRKFVLKTLEGINYIIFILTSIGLVLFLCNISITSDYIRYCGIYTNTNMGSAITVLSIGISLMLLYTKSMNKKIFLIFNIILQVLLIRLCMSRASTIFMFITIILFSIMYLILSKKKPMKIVLSVILIILSILIVYSGASKGLYKIHDIVVQKQQQQQITKVETEDTKEKEPSAPAVEKTQNLHERDEYQKDSSNEIRLKFIKYGLLAAVDHPIFGVGQKGVADAVTVKAGVYYGGITAGGVHNTYVQIAVANGFPSLILFLIIQCIIFIRIIKQIIALRGTDDRHRLLQFSAFTALYLGFLVYGLFESILILNSAILTYAYALIAGGVCDELSNV